MAKLTTSDSMTLAQGRAIEHMPLRGWWLHPFEDGIWARCHAVLDLVDTKTGTKVVQLRGTDTDGDECTFTDVRGVGIQVLTETQGIRCGLRVPEEQR